MGLSLRIENQSQLPDGGSLDFRLTGKSGADIGRDAHLDWTLPDDSRQISGKHCEIRYRDGAYWLTDVSRNGTFLNDADRRMQSPYRLRSGDRLTIGHYIVAVEVDGDAPAMVAAPPRAEPDFPAHEDLWGGIEGAAPPLDPREFRPPSQSRPVRPDFLEWAVDLPNSPGSGFVARPAAGPSPREPVADREAALDWAAEVAQPPPPEPEPSPAVPRPRRSIWVSPGPTGPWGGDPGVSGPEHAPQLPAERAEPPAPRPPPAPAAGFDGQAASTEVLRRFARSAGLPESALAGTDPGEFGDRLGRLMLLVVDNLKQLLNARSQTKRAARSQNQTLVQALDNNPLKFSPSAVEALRIMLGPPTGSYLGADKAIQQGFDDLKTHQVKTFAAMQQALQMLLEDLDPKTIEASAGEGGKWSAVLGSGRARLWDIYVARWQAKTARQEGGALDVFMRYFAECYDRAPGRDPR